MDNIDLIVVWPTNCDYPVWRGMLKLYRLMFTRIIIVFMNPNQGENYRDFVMDSLSGLFIDFVDSPEVGPGEDWRSVAVNAGLEHSTSKWVWFTEQDFFVVNHDRFWPKIKEAMKYNQVIGLREEASNRLHPCCLFVERSLINRTSRDFGVSSHGDHFARFTDQIKNNRLTTLDALGLTERQNADDPAENDWTHLNGLSHNHTLVHDRNYTNIYQPEIFKAYLRQCLDLEELDIELHSRWRQEVTAFLNQ